MRRTLLVVLLLPFLAACGPGNPARVVQGRSHVDVSSPDLVAYKKQTAVPACPKVPSTKAEGGMPAVTLACLGGGRRVDAAGLRGPMIVNFWASWCGSCREEMPALAAYARSQSAVKVLGVDYLDTQPGAALELAKRSNVGYPLVADPEGALDRAHPLPHISAMPMTVFLDRNGAIAHIEFKAYTSKHDVAEAAQQYLGVGG
jgi:thiol-disulfide isomerase/thioredoxin